LSARVDPSTSNGFILLPSRGRVLTNLPRFFRAAAETGMTLPGYVVVDADDFEENGALYRSFELPAGWSFFVSDTRSMADSIRWAMKLLFKDTTDWVMWVADDLVPETPGWDVKLVGELTGWNCVSSDDGWRSPQRFDGALAWSGDLLRAVGYLVPPGVKHMCLDDLWEEIGAAAGCWRTVMDVMLRNHHAALSGMKDPTARHVDATLAHDRLVFEKWRQTDKVAAINRVLAMMQSKGLPIRKIDLTGLKVMLASPAGDGAFDRIFHESYVATRDAIRGLGGEFVFAEAPYISDIALARNKLFAHFLRSDATHLFFIDADQGWSTRDFIRLLTSGKPFSAAAGVRKVSPPSFAVNIVDDDGQPIGVHQLSQDGLLEVSHVGFAFVCLTRDAAVRMAQHYADLTCVGADGQEDVAVFLPMVWNRRWLSEDFAFCQRWRALPGAPKIYVAPDINLKHAGKHVWTGAWVDQLQRTALTEDRDR
jgi:hypothetical protein